MAVLASGLQYFSQSIEYILDYVDCLLEWGEADNACLLLENSITLIGKDECSALWEKLLFIRGAYYMKPTTLQNLTHVCCFHWK